MENNDVRSGAGSTPLARRAFLSASAGINTTTLTWNANPEPNLAGYEVVWRETTAPDWTNVISVGNVTTVTLDMSKDNVQFGVRAVDQSRHRGPVAFPQVVA